MSHREESTGHPSIERLYYADPYCRQFSARSIEQLTWDGRPAVVLDRTAFYPTSGGQPADRGMLGGVAVVDVLVREEDGAIVHLLEDPLPEAGDGLVRGEIDWARRFDHMQQHSGQHLLSAAFEQHLDADTVGFHLGSEASTVDIAVARMDPAVAMEVEALANQVVWEDREISTRFVDSGELARLPLRRPPAVEGPVRIVSVVDRAGGGGPAFDVNPCGGTHVGRTGEIGLIKITRLEYRGDETRVEFLCGRRALSDYQAKHEVVHQLSRRLTVGYWELDESVERLEDEIKETRHRLRQAMSRLLELEAAGLAAGAECREGLAVVWRVWSDREIAEVQALAGQLTRHSDLVALLATVGDRVHLCFACSEGVTVDAAELLREACARLGGKGGGRPQMAQGSAPPVAVDQVEVVLSDLVERIGLQA